MKAKFLFPLLALAAMMGACDGTPDQQGGDDTLLEGKITLIVDHEFIRANGTEAANFTILLQDTSGLFHDVTEDADLYIDGSDQPLAEPKFTTTQSGSWEFYALYGFEVSNEVSVSAVSGIADIPADPAPESTDFNHRILLVQHTGTACPNCPRMMVTLKSLAEDESYVDRYTHVASHCYNPSSDPAGSEAATTLSSHLSVMYCPWVTFNYEKADTDNATDDLVAIQGKIDQLQKATADAGVALSAQVVDGMIYANVAVKAGEAGNYRMAMWVIEDGVFGAQSGKTAPWQDVHSNALREMMGGNRTERIYGKSIGTIEAGKSVENIVAVKLGDSWVAENCEVVVIVTTDDGNGGYDVVNTATCAVGSTLAFEYND